MTEPQTPVEHCVDVPGATNTPPEGHDTRAAISSPEKRSKRYRVGDIVTAHIHTGRFDGRTGTVMATHLGEVGVSFSAAENVDAWFAPAELWRSA